MPLIEITTPATLMRNDPAHPREPTVVTDVAVLKPLHGLRVDDLALADLLEDEGPEGKALLDAGLDGGRPVIEFDPRAQALRCVLRLRCQRALTEPEQAVLVAEAQGQFLDGFGSQPVPVEGSPELWVSISGDPTELRMSRLPSLRDAGGWLSRLLGVARGRSPIFTAIENGDIAQARRLAASAMWHVDARDRFDCSPLMLAVRDGHTEFALELLERGASAVHRSTRNGSSVLDFAAMAGDVAVGRALLMAGADVDGAGGDPDGHTSGMTALMWAANRGHPAFVRLLLDAGAKVDLQDARGGTAAQRVAFQVDGGDRATLAILLEAGADVALPDQHGRTLLIEARAQARNGRPGLRELIEQHRPGAFGDD